MKGGAVREERSPEKEAMDFRNALQEPRFWAETPAPSFSFEDILCLSYSGRVEQSKGGGVGVGVVGIVYAEYLPRYT